MPASHPTAPPVIRCSLCKGTNTAVTLVTTFGEYYWCSDCFDCWFETRSADGFSFRFDPGEHENPVRLANKRRAC